MTAFFVGRIDAIKNPEKFQEYGQKAGQTLQPFGGKPVNRGSFVKALTGDLQPIAMAVFEFPDTQSVLDWYESDDYQAIIPLRQDAVDISISVFEAA